MNIVYKLTTYVNFPTDVALTEFAMRISITPEIPPLLRGAVVQVKLKHTFIFIY